MSPVWFSQSDKIGDVVIPLNTRLVSKQGRDNTKKPVLFVAMMEDVLDFFNVHGIDIRKILEIRTKL